MPNVDQANKLISLSANAPGATTDFGTINPVPSPYTRVVVTVAVSGASKLYVKYNGLATLIALNNNSQLTADTLYTFTVCCDGGTDRLDFQLENNVTLRRFYADGMAGGI